MKHFENDTLQFVIALTLKNLGDYSTVGVKLLELTASLQARHYDAKSQSGLGLYRIEPSTHLQLWDDYLAFKPDLASTIRGLASQKTFLQNPHYELASNLAYASAIAWTIYRRSGLTLPEAEDQKALIACWSECFSDSTQPARHKFTAAKNMCLTPHCSLHRTTREKPQQYDRPGPLISDDLFPLPYINTPIGYEH